MTVMSSKGLSSTENPVLISLDCSICQRLNQICKYVSKKREDVKEK